MCSQHFNEMLGSDHRQTIAAVSRLAAYMGRTGKGINHIFQDLDSSGDGKLSHHELENALVELDINITTAQAHALVTFMDGDGDGEIDVKELDSTIRLYKRRKREGNLGTWHGNLDAQQDPVFPNWLIGRDDFQQGFIRRYSFVTLRFSPEAGAYGALEVESALRKKPEDRLHRDVQVITDWLGQQDSLRSLGAKRLMEITNVVEFRELAPGEQLFAEGDESEAFYMILQGYVVVLVKQCPVAALGPGETFGEIGLQNLQKRTATVKASLCHNRSGAMLVTMRTIDYRHILSRYLMDKMQLKINLLQDTFTLARNWSHSKIRAFAYCMAHHSHAKGEYIFRQGEPAHNLYIVFRGKVLAQRVLRYRFVNRWPVSNTQTHQRNSMKQVTINMKTLSVGDVTGEDCVLGFENRPYQAMALTQDVQVCVVSRSNAFLYLTSGELDELHNQTQDLYRYGGDSNTSYYKAVKGWQDASRMKNEVIGPSYRNRLEGSESQSHSRKSRWNKSTWMRHPQFHGQHRQRQQVDDQTHNMKYSSSRSKLSLSASTQTLSPQTKPAKGTEESHSPSSRSPSHPPTKGTGGIPSGAATVAESSGKCRRLKFPCVESRPGNRWPQQ
ncbi:unnamed protein product [Hapterophycus canaliculatus]